MKSVNVLVVDDDRDFAESLAELLRMHGHLVELAFSPDQGINLFDKGQFALVFMDVKLPGMNGVECLSELRGMDPGVRVVMMSGFSVQALLDEAMQGGAVAVMSKPLDLDRVFELIQGLRETSILLVDDDADFGETIREFLSTKGFSVVRAESGEEAIRFATKQKFDAIVLDQRLPGLSGAEVLTRLMPEGKTIPTIFVTAYAEEKEGLQRLMASSKSIRVLPKPFEPGELLEMLASLENG